jgi:hypothetical protein
LQVESWGLVPLLFLNVPNIFVDAGIKESRYLSP